MIEPTLVRRVSAMTLSLAAAGAAAALAAGSARVAGGIGAGAALGLLPIVSWSILGSLLLPRHHPAVAPQEPMSRNGAKAGLLFAAISLGKLLLYAAALAILIGKDLVHPAAFGTALLFPSLFLAIAASVRRDGAPARPRDDASARQA